VIVASAIARTAGAQQSIEDLRAKFRLPVPEVGLATETGRFPRGAPGTSSGSPIAFGANWNDAFIGAVCRGAAKDEWWSQRELKPTNVFGFGANLDDKKFENVEKLYQIGRRVEYSETRAAQATEEAQARWEEYNREQDAIDEAQELAAEEARREDQEIYTAWDARKKEGWSEIANDAVVAIAVQTLRSKLNNTESYDEFLRKAFSGYIGLKLTPREFADARMAIHPVDWRKCPLADAYIWYTKENA